MKTILRAKYYPRGTFIIRKNGQYKEKYSLSVISRARRKDNEKSQGWFPTIKLRPQKEIEFSARILVKIQRKNIRISEFRRGETVESNYKTLYDSYGKD